MTYAILALPVDSDNAVMVSWGYEDALDAEDALEAMDMDGYHSAWIVAHDEDDADADADADAFASAGWGIDRDYSRFGDDY